MEQRKDRFTRLWAKYRNEEERKGLTLVELAIVLLVLGIIMGMVYGSLDFSAVDKAKVLGVKNNARKLQAYLQMYETENGRLEELTPLTAIVGKSPVDEEGVEDPWNNPYFICSDEQGQRQICSYGADGEQGGDGENQDFYLTDKNSWPAWLSGETQEEE